MKNFVRFLRDESGATAIEYALILAAVGTALLLVGPKLNTIVSTVFDNAATAVNG